MKVLGIIPARYASTRFPAKALTTIKNKPMIQWVVERSAQSKLSEVIVATDHEEIMSVVHKFGGKAIMTSENHQSGTDRCKEAYEKLGYKADFIINIQGDEPLIAPEQINLLIDNLKSDIQLATLRKRIEDHETLFNPNTPKVIVDAHNKAIYFSRNTIPYIRGEEQSQWLTKFPYFKHIGIYAYRSDVLNEITQLPIGNLEKAESLEQLRWLENGYSIHVFETKIETIGVDTPDDLLKIQPYLHLL